MSIPENLAQCSHDSELVWLCGCRYCQAVDAPKTGVEVCIPDHYRNPLKGTLPPWHSRRVKEEQRAAALGRSSSGSGRKALSGANLERMLAASKVCG